MTDPKLAEWLLNEIREELNVKEVRIATDDREHVDLTAKPNYKTLGKRLGPKVKELAQALMGLDQSALWELSDTGSLVLAGETFTREEILLEKTAKPGRVVATDSRITVILDTTITPELERDGWVREFSSIVQAQRKELGLNVSQHIRIALHCEFRLAEALLSSQQDFLNSLRCQELTTVLSLDPESFEGEFVRGEIDDMVFFFRVIPC